MNIHERTTVPLFAVAAGGAFIATVLVSITVWIMIRFGSIEQAHATSVAAQEVQNATFKQRLDGHRDLIHAQAESLVEINRHVTRTEQMVEDLWKLRSR